VVNLAIHYYSILCYIITEHSCSVRFDKNAIVHFKLRFDRPEQSRRCWQNHIPTNECCLFIHCRVPQYHKIKYVYADGPPIQTLVSAEN